MRYLLCVFPYFLYLEIKNPLPLKSVVQREEILQVYPCWGFLFLTDVIKPLADQLEITKNGSGARTNTWQWHSGAGAHLTSLDLISFGTRACLTDAAAPSNGGQLSEWRISLETSEAKQGKSVLNSARLMVQPHAHKSRFCHFYHVSKIYNSIIT